MPFWAARARDSIGFQRMSGNLNMGNKHLILSLEVVLIIKFSSNVLSKF
jgi:hypothetical protein